MRAARSCELAACSLFLAAPTAASDMCDEASRYRETCAAEHDIISAELAARRDTRALLIEFAGHSQWGLGHILPALFLAHDLCRSLRRYCYVRLYEMEVGKLFGYANGMTWEPPSAAALHSTFGSNASNISSCGVLGRATSSPMLRRLQSDPAALIRLRCFGNIPFADKTRSLLPALSDSASSTPDKSGASPGRRLSRCFCRFVSEPLFTCPDPPGGDTYHLRTGFADVPNNDLRLFLRLAWVPSAHLALAPGGTARLDVPRERARWRQLACPATLPKSARAISDSPALSRLGVGGGAPKDAKGGWSSTRSWGRDMASKLRAARDVACIGGRSERLFTAVSSSFALPIAARSLCLRKVLPLGSAPSACTAFEATFPRDLYTETLQTPERYNRTRAALRSWHPCANAPPSECRARFLAATF